METSLTSLPSEGHILIYSPPCNIYVTGFGGVVVREPLTKAILLAVVVVSSIDRATVKLPTLLPLMFASDRVSVQ